MDQQNLLRVALVLTSSGLDACCKRLLRDALPDLIERNGTAAAKFDGFIEEQLSLDPPIRECGRCFLTRSGHGVRMLAKSDGRPQDLAAEGVDCWSLRGLVVGPAPWRAGRSGRRVPTNQAMVWACGQVG
jgi:hypothetical protein